MAEKIKDLEIIKRKYGEKMAQLCRELFPTLLETEGLLSDTLLAKFNEDKTLYDVIVNKNKKEDFKNYIYSFIDVEKEQETKAPVTKTPRELLGEAGYDFFECKTQEEIQAFKKYYAGGEALCTFNGNRLNTNHVFWAVKKNVDEIKREMFEKPERQDEYGTSVISIQFSRGKLNDLSIKNRYNHKVTNPDATFGNNPDRIIEGLTESFKQEYGFNFTVNKTGFELPNFVLDEDGKLHRYNYEINNRYYCPDNKIIHNGKVTALDSAKQLLIDYFVVDVTGENKEINLHDEGISDSFVDGFKNAKMISIKTPSKDEKKAGIFYEKKVIVTLEEGDVTIELDKDNRIIGYDNPYLKHVGYSFMYNNNSLKNLSLEQVKQIEDDFLYNNKSLVNLSLEQVERIGISFLYNNNSLTNLSLEQVKQIEYNFLYNNNSLADISLPQAERIGNYFLRENNSLINLLLDKVEQIGYGFLYCNNLLESLSLEQVRQIGDDFLRNNNSLKNLFAPQLSQKGDSFLENHKKFGGMSVEDIRAQSVAQTADTINPSVLRHASGVFSGLKKPERQTEYNKSEYNRSEYNKEEKQ